MILLIGVVYVALLVGCLIMFAVRGRDPTIPVDSNTLSLIDKALDYSAMVLLAPVYICVETSKYLYRNYPVLIPRFFNFVCRCVLRGIDAVASVLRRIGNLFIRITNGVVSFFNWIGEIVTSVTRWFGDLFRLIYNWIVSVLSPPVEWVKAQIDRFGRYLDSVWDRIKSYVRSCLIAIARRLRVYLMVFKLWLYDTAVACAQQFVRFIEYAIVKLRIAGNWLARLIVRWIIWIDENYDAIVRYVTDTFRRWWNSVYDRVLYPAYYYIIYMPYLLVKTYVFDAMLYKGYLMMYDLYDKLCIGFNRAWEKIIELYNRQFMYNLYLRCYARIDLEFQALYMHYQRVCDNVWRVWGYDAVPEKSDASTPSTVTETKKNK